MPLTIKDLPLPSRQGPRDDSTAQILTGEHSSVRLPPRDRGSLVLLSGPTPGALRCLDGGELLVGRGTEAELSFDDASLSRRHARLFRVSDGYYVEDLGSTNGTFVNGERLRGARKLRDGDRIQIGLSTLLRFVLQDAIEQRATQQLYESAVRDALTGLSNRRYLDERLAAEHSFALRHGTELTVMMCDVDHFKKVNDTYGHAAGDAVLRVVGRSLQRMLRAEDLVARCGGEEFCVVARSLDRANAAIVAERCRKSIAALRPPWEGRVLSVTVSIGIATLSPERPFREPEALLAAADGALYRAKASGRDRVCHA